MQYRNYLGHLMHQSAKPTASADGTSAGGETITAPPGPSSVSGDGGGDTLIGSNGDNIFYIADPNDRIVIPGGQPGIKTAIAWMPFTLPAHVQNLIVHQDFNFAAGNGMANLIKVGGRQWVDGRGGNDVLVGGKGDATFVEQVGQGNDVIYGWHSDDQVQLLGASFRNFSQIQSAMSQSGNDVLLQMAPNQTLTFRNTTLGDFEKGSFLMPLDRSQLGALSFDDEFNKLDLYNPSSGKGVWQTNFGGNLQDQWAYQLPPNGEEEVYTTRAFRGSGNHPLGYNPFSIQNGKLVITAQPIAPADRQAAFFAHYSSGMINTLGSFQQQYGYFEMRAELPSAAGTWPAFWMQPNPWVPDSEADITEDLGITPNVDYVRADGGNQSIFDNAYKPVSGGFHTYGMLWTPTTVTFYEDGIAVATGPTPSSWTHPMALIANLAIGGPWAGAPDANAFPASMKIDYIRAYTLADGSSIVDRTKPQAPAGTIHNAGAPVAHTASNAQVRIADFSANGAPVTSKHVVFQHAAPDPKHLPNGDRLIVWEDSGTVMAAETRHQTLSQTMTLRDGFVSQFVAATWLTDNKVALLYMEKDHGVEDLWSLVVNPKNGRVTTQELGRTSGSDVHIVAMKNGGFAASWANGSVIDAAVYDAKAYDHTWVGPVRQIAGDLVGVNAKGRLIVMDPNNANDRLLYAVDTSADTPPASISISPAEISHKEGNSGLTAYRFTLTRSFNLSGTSTVTWAVQGDGANPANASDFKNGHLPSGSVTFAPGDTQHIVTVYVRGDTQPEANEGFTFTLTGVTGANLGQAVSLATIANDDGSSAAAAPAVHAAAAPHETATGHQVLAGTAAADVLAAGHSHGTLEGQGGNDVLLAGTNAATLIGGAGDDRFLFRTIPSHAAQVMDFSHGQDVLDLHRLFAGNGYAGSDPLHDGYVVLAADGHGGTLLYYDHDGRGGDPAFRIADLHHVTPHDIVSADILF